MTTPSSSHVLRVGSFFVVLYALCIVWPIVYPYDTDVLAHHLLSLKLLFPGFQGYDFGSIIWGGVLSFIYSAIGSMIFHGFHSDCCKGKK